MGGKSSGKKGNDTPNVQAQVNPYLQGLAGMAQQQFAEVSPLRQGLIGGFSDLLGIQAGGVGGGAATGASSGGAGGGKTGFAASSTPPTVSAGSKLGQAPTLSGAKNGGSVGGATATNLGALSTPDIFRARDINMMAGNIATNVPTIAAPHITADPITGAQIQGPGAISVGPIAGVDPITAQLTGSQNFDAARALDLANTFTALPNNVTGFGAAKELAERQFARAKQDALSSIGGAGGAGAINSTIAGLASDRAMGMANVFNTLAQNEALARERGFERGIGIETADINRALAAAQGDAGRTLTADQINAANLLNTQQFNAGTDLTQQQINAGNVLATQQFNAGNDLATQQFNAAQSLTAADANAGRDFSASQTMADMQFRGDQADIDRSIANLQNRANAQNAADQATIDRALSLATGQSGAAMSGYGTAGNISAQSALGQAQIAQSANNATSAKKGSTGQAIGQIVAAGKKAA